MNTTPPKAFVSHSSADQDRFVREFSRRLREDGGIDAWFSEWELAPGDSLVDGIYEGIKDAQTFILVLSPNSIKSKWVTEEINGGFVRKVENGCRFITVRLDRVDIPEPLRHTIWVDIDDFNNYDKQFARIRDIIFEIRNKPAIGQAPTHSILTITPPSGLSKLEFFLLTQIFEEQFNNKKSTIDTKEFIEAAIKHGWKEDIIAESFNFLRDELYIYTHYVLNRSSYPKTVYLQTRGWEIMLRSTKKDYGSALKSLAVYLVDHASEYGRKSDHNLAEAIGQDDEFTRRLLENLENQGYITLSKYLGSTYFVTSVKPYLRKALEGGLLDD
ncbi:hypothetical protein IAD21_00616 [Abditibacteriota bacterium]|nr:hypothetical protein IAD21_00616 [Abditibacteriota bacterium]